MEKDGEMAARSGEPKENQGAMLVLPLQLPDF
jgi:hypothetical protein